MTYSLARKNHEKLREIVATLYPSYEDEGALILESKRKLLLLVDSYIADLKRKLIKVLLHEDFHFALYRAQETIKSNSDLITHMAIKGKSLKTIKYTLYAKNDFLKSYVVHSIKVNPNSPNYDMAFDHEISRAENLRRKFVFSRRDYQRGVLNLYFSVTTHRSNLKRVSDYDLFLYKKFNGFDRFAAKVRTKLVNDNWKPFVLSRRGLIKGGVLINFDLSDRANESPSISVPLTNIASGEEVYHDRLTCTDYGGKQLSENDMFYRINQAVAKLQELSEDQLSMIA